MGPSSYTYAPHGDDHEAVVTNDDAQKALKRLGDYAVEQIRSRSSWEGDPARPLFSGLPMDDPDSEVMVAVKQSNDGAPYIWSPWSFRGLRGSEPRPSRRDLARRVA
jgi:hypothetical protein